MFLAEMLLIYPVLGVSVFQTAAAQPSDSAPLYLTGDACKATGAETADGFVVYAGSFARGSVTPAFKQYSRGYAALREALIEAQHLVTTDGGVQLRLTQDYPFKSSTAAATIFLGTPVSGPTTWKTKDGITLKELHSESSGGTDGEEDEASSAPAISSPVV